MEQDEPKAGNPAQPDAERSASFVSDDEEVPENLLRRLAEAVADGDRVNWGEEAGLAPEAQGAADSLRTIESISHLCHRVGESEHPGIHAGAAPAAWGEYVLQEKLGEGSFAEVYRATDPILQRPVALKLFKPGARPTGHGMEGFLDEARRLAQVRHPNVIVVHGADVHGGRAGLCTELLQGDTLEDVLAQRGRFGAHEAALVGVELCSALAALHAAGFVHGDVKASNVMRAEGGRIVLMDFGSSAVAAVPRDLEASGTKRAASASGVPPRTGTPLVLPPEVLQGGVATEAADVYQLGALLYRLVTGSYPHPAQDFQELKAMHQRRQVRRLRDLRADLPAPFVQVVERALHADPRGRFPSMGGMEEALRSTLLAGARERRRRKSWKWAGALAALLVLLVAASVVSRKARFLATPIEVQTALYHLQEGRPRPLQPQSGARLQPGDALFMTLESRDDLHVYVLNEATSEPGVINTLFPDPGLRLQNPLRGGVLHRLPSDSDGEAFWQTTAMGGIEKILVVASREAYDAMEAVVTRSPEGSAPTEPELDAERLEALGLRAIELRKQGAIRMSRIDRMTRLLEAERRQGKEIWFEVIRLESGAVDPP